MTISDLSFETRPNISKLSSASLYDLEKNGLIQKVLTEEEYQACRSISEKLNKDSNAKRSADSANFNNGIKNTKKAIKQVAHHYFEN